MLNQHYQKEKIVNLQTKVNLENKLRQNRIHAMKTLYARTEEAVMSILKEQLTASVEMDLLEATVKQVYLCVNVKFGIKTEGTSHNLE